MPKLIQIMIGEDRYNSIREAWRAESPPGLPEITVRRRLAAGWEPVDAFKCRPVPPKDRRGFKKLRVET